MSSLIQNITSIFLVIAILFFGWFVWADMNSDDVSTSDPREQAEYQTREFRSILSDLNSINLDSPLLTDASFLRMDDITQEILDRPIGRENPFEAIQ